jgi:hypothetical protein
MATKQATPEGQAPVDHEEVKSKYDYDFAEGWKPEPGDVLEGRITGIDTGTNDYGSYPIVTVQREDGTSGAVHCFHSTIRGQLARLRPMVGNKIGIKYMGKRKAKNPTPGRSDYADYRVKMPEGGYDWAQEEGFRPLNDDEPNF